MNTNDDKSLAQLLDTLIRSGNSGRAQKVLRGRIHSRHQNPFEPGMIRNFAALCRRAGRPDWGVLLLRPVVRPSEKEISYATDAEKAEYGVCLGQIGAPREALALLQTIDVTQEPITLFYQAITFFTRWEYAEAIPLLKQFIEQCDPNLYIRKIATINLVSALVKEEHYDEALMRLSELDPTLRAAEFSLLRGNANELRGQALILSDRLQEAQNLINSALEATSGAATLDAFFARKWATILKLRQNGPTKENAQRFSLLRAEARERDHSESVRECDLFWALGARDQALLERVFFGTPLPAYRRRIIRMATHQGMPTAFTDRQSFEWESSHAHHATTKPYTYDLRTASWPKPNQLLYRLLVTLASDTYKPFTVQELHLEIFPERYYNPQTSPGSVRQALHRLRAEFATRRIPLRVEENRARYRLEGYPERPCKIILPAAGEPADLRQLLSRFKSSETFNSKHAADIWGISPRQAQRRLNVFVEAGVLTRTGATRDCGFSIRPVTK